MARRECAPKYTWRFLPHGLIYPFRIFKLGKFVLTWHAEMRLRLTASTCKAVMSLQADGPVGNFLERKLWKHDDICSYVMCVDMIHPLASSFK